MNTGVHVVRNKKVYAVRDIDPKFRTWLENRTGCRLTKLTLESKPGQGFWRWKLVGIKDKEYGYYVYGSVFEELVPELRYIFGDSLLWVLSFMSDGRVLGLDFRNQEDIFQRVDEKKLEFVDSDEFLTWRAETYKEKPKLIEYYWFK